MRHRIYIAGPLGRGPDRIQNVERAAAAMLELLRLGYAPHCAHLTAYIDSDDSLGYDNWIESDLAWVACADVVLRLPGRSPGADKETACAAERHIPVVERIEDIDAAIVMRAGW